MNLTFPIGYFFACSPPALVKPEDIFVLRHRIDCRSHAVVKEGIGFGEVYDIENVVPVRSHALD